MRYFIIKKMSFNPKDGLYYAYTKDDADGMSRKDHKFTFDIEDAYRFTDLYTAQLAADHLSQIMGIAFGLQRV